MKRNRKIFAILTLVAFMMTLLPVAAFAAYDRHASILRVDDESVEADGESAAEFTVYARQSNNNPSTDWVYVASERSSDVIVPTFDGSNRAEYKAVYYPVDKTDNKLGESFLTINVGQVIVADDNDKEDFTEYKEDGKVDKTNYDHAVHDILANHDAYVVAFEPNAGKVEFEVRSTVAGEADIAVGFAGGVGSDVHAYSYLVDSDVTANNAAIIGTKTITFEATKTSDVQLTKVEGRKGGSVKVPVSPAKDKGDREYGSKSSGLKIVAPNVVKANGTDYFELTFQVKNDSNAPVEDEKVEFSANKANVTFNKEEAETDEVGEVTVKVFANKAGNYEIEAAVGSKTAKVWLEFAPADVSELELVKSTAELVAIEEEYVDSFKLEFKDANGNRIDPLTIEDLKDELEFEWITEPSGSDLDDKFWTNAIAKLSVKDKKEDNKVKVTNDNLLQLWLPELDEEGKYELKINIQNGKAVTVEFEGREQGEITQLTLSYDSASVQLNGVSSGATVKRLDKDGVAVSLSDNQKKNDIEWSISDYRVLKDGYKDLQKTAGVLYITDDDDYIGQYTVVAVDKKNDLTATTEITVGNEIIGIDVELPEGKLPVGRDSVVTVKTIDADGNEIALGTEATNVEFSYYVTSQPAGAKASATETASEGKFQTDLKEKGKANVDVYSNVEGTVNMVVVVSYDLPETTEVFKAVEDEDGDIVEYVKTTEKTGNTKTHKFTKAITLDFAEETAPVVYGAKNVTMFIGSTGFVADGAAGTMDQAPFIQDNRTFVPLRAVATALGATNEDTMWDPATQTITLVRPDLTVTMTIGSNVLTLSDGSTVVADVAPFIVAETGRTVIPFRAIAEAFGADVEAVFAADGTTTAVTFSQE